MHESEDLQCLFKMLRGKLQVWVPYTWNSFPKEDVRSFESSGQPVVICRNNLVDMPQVASKTVGYHRSGLLPEAYSLGEILTQ